ncbi:hypothetical protein Rhopal_003860-T1 [Rhodotorula paludigena]|uniref:Uncharacterized protein n=1 Tax=Rhodotorula paludigena TaxID=86838 RepID=A0AAV5GEM0_9BASI|nr:hypothetical protein Rhopal_003860-T1 [Rhodotorula paludigena]
MLHFSHALRPSSLLSTARSFTSSLFSRSPSPDKEDAASLSPVEMEDPQPYTFYGPSPTQQFCAPLPRYHDYTAYAAPEPQSRFSSPSSSSSSGPSSSPASLFSAHPSPTSTAATSGGSPSSTSFAAAAAEEDGEEKAAWYCPPTRPWSDLGPSTVAHLESLAAHPPARCEAPRARRGWGWDEKEGERVVRRLEEMVARWDGVAVGRDGEEEEEEEEEEEGWMEWA